MQNTRRRVVYKKREKELQKESEIRKGNGYESNGSGSIITSHFPNCDVALLGGSVARGEATKTSDLDIVIIDPSLSSCYRESFYSNGWPVEVFVHNFETYKTFLKWIAIAGDLRYHN